MVAGCPKPRQGPGHDAVHGVALDRAIGSMLQLIESLRPGPGAALAFLVALAIALLARRLRSVPWAAIAAGAGILAGWWASFGLLTATPRQLPERLPLLMLAMVVLVSLAGALARRWPRAAWPLAMLVSLLAGWWMAGAPQTLPDFGRSWPVLTGVTLASLVMAAAGVGRWSRLGAAAALALGLAAAGWPGPGSLLAVILLAGVLGAALPAASSHGSAAPLEALPVTVALAALGVIPILARGIWADLVGGLAPLAALLLGAMFGRRFAGEGRQALAVLLVGLAVALLAFHLR